LIQGIGKRVPIKDFHLKKGRTGKGLTAIRVAKGDHLAAAIVVGVGKETDGSEPDNVSKTGEDLLVSTTSGMLLRVALQDVSVFARTAKGHRIAKLKDGDEVTSVTLMNKE
jgi:DNA gyrase subunit A